MTEKSKKFAVELDQLITEGKLLESAIQYNCNKAAFVNQLNRAFENNEEKITQFLEKLPKFATSYQKWYSKAQAIIAQVMPSRLSDFNSYFESSRIRKDITFQNYMIRDYLQGLQITRHGGTETVADGSAAIPEFQQQLHMVEAARDLLDSTLLDLKAVLQADLFDSEIETAEALSKAGYLRASGAICGVVIEKHLRHICDIHNVKIKKKNPGISDLNQLLRDSSITEIPQWRFIQHLADIRNVCGHDKNREPTKEEIGDLVAGSQKVLKTVF